MNVLSATSGGDPSWSLGVLIGGPVVALLSLICIAVFIFGFIDRDHGIGPMVGAGIGLVLTLGIAAMPVIGFYPYNAEYHQWTPTEGVVAKADKRLIGSGSGMEEKFVVRFEGSGQQYGCDDTRCAGVERGDRLALTCKRAWQYTGVDGYDCRFVSTESAS